MCNGIGVRIHLALRAQHTTNNNDFLGVRWIFRSVYVTVRVVRSIRIYFLRRFVGFSFFYYRLSLTYNNTWHRYFIAISNTHQLDYTYYCTAAAVCCMSRLVTRNIIPTTYLCMGYVTALLLVLSQVITTHTPGGWKRVSVECA